MFWKRSFPKIARGERIYAIGDIHGRMDLFADLVAQIRTDAEARKPRRTKLIIIGDFIDRGPRSAEIVELLHRTTKETKDCIVLRGNHEQMMLLALRGDLEILEAWLKYGGKETLESWGVDTTQSLGDILAESATRVPRAILHWFSGLPLAYRSGNFLFVHAGIRPGVPLAKQDPDDYLWIGRDFLDYDGDHPAVVVHGHSICTEGPEIFRHRIGLDTGAYRTGRLSAVGFEGDTQWPLTTSSQPAP